METISLAKPETTDIRVHPLIKKRWSPRAFSSREVEPEKLCQLFEAARWAPSSYNEQPWRFIVATRREPEKFSLLFQCLKEGNRRWAGNAPVLVLSVARTRFRHNGQPNRHALHDVGLAVGNLLLQAMALDLYVHQMAGFDPESARQLLQIPEEFEPVAMMAIGYLGDVAQLPADLAEKERAPRKRKALSELVFDGSWGRPFCR